MDQAVVARLRSELDRERSELVRELKALGVSPETGNPQDMEYEHGFADSGQATAEKARALSVAESLFTTLQEVDAALERIDNGKYGVCESCGSEIPIERLEARPHVRLCVQCKQRQE